MRIGIVGLAQSGKKTLFTLMTGAEPPPSRGRASPRGGSDLPVVAGRVPDDRVERLAAVYGAKKTRLAEIEWALFPVLPADNKQRREWFDAARELDGLCCVVRQFTDPGVYHEDGCVDPARDAARLDLELAVADLEVIETRLERLSRETAKRTAAERAKQEELLGRLVTEIEAERPLRALELSEADEARLSGLKFVGRKACMIALNVDEAAVAANGDETKLSEIAQSLSVQGREVTCVSAKVEAELQEIEDPAERAEFAKELGLEGSGRARLARAALKSLGLITFLTANKNEAGAHLVREGATAVEAAGAVHTDFESGFIRAEVMGLDELVAAGSEAALRRQGKLATKGKDYVVQEGDVVHILANV